MSGQRGTLALVVCGALVQDVHAVVAAHAWRARVFAVSPLHHSHPERLAEAVEQQLEELEGRYEKIVVVLGDCGTNGALDEVLRRHGVARTEGPHCYAMLGGEAYEAIAAEHPGTYFITPWLVRNFDRVVVRGLGLDAHPELVSVYFGNYTDLVYLRRAPDVALERRAAEIAEALGLPLSIHEAGITELERRLVPLVEA
jgi:hypothetical protein